MAKGKGKGKKGGKKGKGKGEGGGERPASRHMVPTALGLSFCVAFEELDGELCRPPIRAYMEKQCQQIAEGLLEKDDVVQENIKLFHGKFQAFRDKLGQLERFFVPKDQIDSMGYRGGGAGDSGFSGGKAGGWGGADRGGASHWNGEGNYGKQNGGWNNGGGASAGESAGRKGKGGRGGGKRGGGYKG